MAQILPAQSSGRAKTPKGPRALGLLELMPNGKARLLPVAILDEGKFYDAAAYKATPVPMALESETVYEAIHAGVSQGLFTVTGALHGQDDTWIGVGNWQSAATLAAKKTPAHAVSKPSDEDLDAPPKLRRPGTPKATEASEPQTKADAAPAAPLAPAMPSAAPPAQTPEDTDHPLLRRGKPTPELPEPPGKPPAASSPPVGHASVDAKVQLIPAISDADGPDLRPYAYDMKPEEEQQLRKKMLALAAEDVFARAKQLATETVGAPGHPSGPSGKAAPRGRVPQPGFDDVQLRVFDLSNSNEPVLVLTATAKLVLHPGAKEVTGTDVSYFVTLVARADLSGDLRKAFSNVTDPRHLDVLPRLEFIDAVDADGDSRGELLFRQISDAGSAFSIYRVIGQQLYPLFQGTLGQ
jgi:hypothetical protein